MSATPLPIDPDRSGIAAAAPAQRIALVAGLGVLLGLALALHGREPRLALLLVLGALCGVTLYHAAFGFAAAYRRLLFSRDGAGGRAQLVMLGLALCLFAPVLAAGSFLGSPVVGASAPVGWQVAIGAFLFGVGMQLGNGCGSGTLFALGGGSVRMAAVLIAYCAGGFAASLHMDVWQALPDAGEVVLGEALGWPGAVAIQLAAPVRTLAGRGVDQGLAHGLRRKTRLRLQHRRILFRNRLDQPAWLAVDRGGIAGQLDRRAPSDQFWPRVRRGTPLSRAGVVLRSIATPS